MDISDILQQIIKQYNEQVLPHGFRVKYKFYRQLSFAVVYQLELENIITNEKTVIANYIFPYEDIQQENSKYN